MYTVYTTQKLKKSVHFCQYTKKWLEIKFLMHDSVASAAQRGRVLVNHFQASQSEHTKSTIHLCGMYQKNLFDVMMIMIMTMIMIMMII